MAVAHYMDLLCDCTYLWAARVCRAISAVRTDSTHITQLIAQESSLTQHFELKQKLHIYIYIYIYIYI